MPITAADTRTNSALDFLLQTENKNLKEFNSVWFPEKWKISKNGTTPYFCKYLLFSGDYEVDWRRDKKNKKKGQKKNFCYHSLLWWAYIYCHGTDQTRSWSIKSGALFKWKSIGMSKRRGETWKRLPPGGWYWRDGTAIQFDLKFPRVFRKRI